MTYDVDAEIRLNLNTGMKNLFYLDENTGCYIQTPAVFENSAELFALVLLPADGMPVRCSSSYMSILFCDEDAFVQIGAQKTFCFAGNIFLFRSKCDFIVEPKAGAVLYLALYKKEIFDTLFISQMGDCPIIYDFLNLNNCRNEYLFFDCSNRMPIYYFAKALQAELCGKDKLADKTVRCSTVLFLTNLHRIHRGNLVIRESSMMEEYTIGHILKYMSENYPTATLSSVAVHFNYHPAYFSTLFHQLAHCSFTTKLQEIRLEQARRMLASTRFDIQKICEGIGFKEKSYFYRSFKKAYGVTPGKYRRNILDNKKTGI